MAEKLTELFNCMGGRRLSYKNLRMHPKSTYTSGKEIHSFVTTIEATPPMHCWEDTIKTSVEPPECSS